jgi:cyclophilin family peptidyl-prolyl cis-trans isomerase
VIPDDPTYVQPNVRGTISFATAGPNTRTTQLFINTNDNQDYLDAMGFTPIGMIVPTSSDDNPMETIVPYIAKPKTKPNEDGIDQDHYMKYGNEWLLQHYPEVDMILNTTLVVVAVVMGTTEDNHKTPPTTKHHINSMGRISLPDENDDNNNAIILPQRHRFQNRQYNNDNDNE